MCKIINLTPHTINIYAGDVLECIRTIEPSGVARADYTQETLGNLDGIPIVRNEYGLPTNLPAPQEGVYYIVSKLVADAARNNGRATDDLLLTGELVRDNDNRVIGCRVLCKY